LVPGHGVGTCTRLWAGLKSWDNPAVFQKIQGRNIVMATENTPELKMDPANLYREEIFTDRKIGTIRVMTPVKNDSSVDAGRKVIYVGETQLMTPVGALPLAFEIEADSLGKAAEKFAEVAAVAVERAVKELQELRRQQSSSIVIPEGIPPGMGGGKIKLP